MTGEWIFQCQWKRDGIDPNKWVASGCQIDDASLFSQRAEHLYAMDRKFYNDAHRWYNKKTGAVEDAETYRNIPADQPTPKGTGREIMPLVIADLVKRTEKGVATYGEPLKADNGRDALRDAYEEALDLAMYLRQAMEERG